MPDLTIRQITNEIRTINIDKGFRSATGGPGDNTWGDYMALLHTEAAEATEAYRDHKLADATADEPVGPGGAPILAKPEGVGSELADVVIRLLDTCDVFGFEPFDMDMQLADVAPFTVNDQRRTFGDWMAWLHRRIAALDATITPQHRRLHASYVLRTVASVADHYGIDLTAECQRKIAYNRTREFQHGNRTLADGNGNA